MLTLVLAAMQLAPLGALSQALPAERRLSIVFVRRNEGRRPKISGTSIEPTEWSRSSLYGIVRGCGATRTGVQSANPRAIVVQADSTDRDLDIVRCVKASTSLRFNAGVRELSRTGHRVDDQPFKPLWDGEMAAVGTR